jgi:hypothetical protein
MYGGSFPTELPLHDPATPQPQPQQHQSWQAQQPCPISPFDLMLRPDSSGSHSGASPFDFPSMASPLAHPSGPLSHIPSPPQMLPGMLAPPGRPPLVSPFDIPNGRVQQLLANSTINSGALGRPPPSPFDQPPSGRGARWPFDLVLGACRLAFQSLAAARGPVMHAILVSICCRAQNEEAAFLSGMPNTCTMSTPAHSARCRAERRLAWTMR